MKRGSRVTTMHLSCRETSQGEMVFTNHLKLRRLLLYPQYLIFAPRLVNQASSECFEAIFSSPRGDQ